MVEICQPSARKLDLSPQPLAHSFSFFHPVVPIFAAFERCFADCNVSLPPFTHLPPCPPIEGSPASGIVTQTAASTNKNRSPRLRSNPALTNTTNPRPKTPTPPAAPTPIASMPTSRSSQPRTVPIDQRTKRTTMRSLPQREASPIQSRSLFKIC